MRSKGQGETEPPKKADDLAVAPTLLPDSDPPTTPIFRSKVDSAATVGFDAAPSTSEGDFQLTGVPIELIEHPRYRIVRKLGSGGMGDVFLAEHRVMMRPVAIKMINPSLVRNDRLIERFRREIRAAAALAHPNIVVAFDAEQAGNLHFLVMEFVEGIDLSHLLKQSGPLSCAKACHYVRQAAIGLQHAFEKGMAHRDIKPHNLILAEKNQIKILDFGLARIATEEASGEGLTEFGSYMGTADYIAPEQASDARTADIRADIYSLGCTLYQLLSGCVPFEGGSQIDKIVRHVNVEPRAIEELRPDIPPELATVVRRMMAKDVNQRYQQPIEVVRAIEPIQRALTAKKPASESETTVVRLEQKTPAGSRAIVIDRAAKSDPVAPVAPARTPPRREPTPPKKAAPRSAVTSSWVWTLAGCTVAALGIWGAGAFSKRAPNTNSANKPAKALKTPETPPAPPNVEPETPKSAPASDPLPPPKASEAVPTAPNAKALGGVFTKGSARIVQSGPLTIFTEAGPEAMRSWIDSLRGNNKFVRTLGAQTVGEKVAFFATAYETPRSGAGKVEFDLTASQLPGRITAHADSNVRARSIAAYVVDGASRFAVLWGRIAPLEKYEFATDLTLDEYQNLGSDSGQSLGWLGLQGYSLNGVDAFVVFRAKPAPAVSKLWVYSFADRFQNAMEKNRIEHPELMPLDISMWNVGDTRRFTVAFMANPRKVTWEADYDVPAFEIAGKVHARIDKGWQLRDMAANEKMGVVRYTIVWIRRPNGEPDAPFDAEPQEADSSNEPAKKILNRKKRAKNKN